jgi:hypothetical protein
MLHAARGKLQPEKRCVPSALTGGAHSPRSNIGPRRLIRLEKPVTAQRLRLRIMQSAASPVLAEFVVCGAAI